MAANPDLPRRLIIAIGIALATAIAPAAAVLAGFGSPGDNVTTADPTQPCTIVQNSGSNSVVCKPNGIMPDTNLPSEQRLTQQNETRH